MKVSGVLAKSASVMKSMNDLIKLPAIQQTMMAMGREMEKVRLSLTLTLSDHHPHLNECFPST
jgi:hypothetical protein